MVLAVIGGAIKSSSIISSVSSSPVNDEEDFVGDYEYGFLSCSNLFRKSETGHDKINFYSRWICDHVPFDLNWTSEFHHFLHWSVYPKLLLQMLLQMYILRLFREPNLLFRLHERTIDHYDPISPNMYREMLEIVLRNFQRDLSNFLHFRHIFLLLRFEFLNFKRTESIFTNTWKKANSWKSSPFSSSSLSLSVLDELTVLSSTSSDGIFSVDKRIIRNYLNFIQKSMLWQKSNMDQMILSNSISNKYFRGRKITCFNLYSTRNISTIDATNKKIENLKKKFCLNIYLESIQSNFECLTFMGCQIFGYNEFPPPDDTWTLGLENCAWLLSEWVDFHTSYEIMKWRWCSEILNFILMLQNNKM